MTIKSESWQKTVLIRHDIDKCQLLKSTYIIWRVIWSFGRISGIISVKLILPWIVIGNYAKDIT